MFVVGVRGGPLAGDFHHELYPEAKFLLQGENPFPEATWDPTAQSNLIWPPLAGYLVSPLTVLPVGFADVVIIAIGLACFAASLGSSASGTGASTVSSLFGQRWSERCASPT